MKKILLKKKVVKLNLIFWRDNTAQINPIMTEAVLI